MYLREQINKLYENFINENEFIKGINPEIKEEYSNVFSLINNIKSKIKTEKQFSEDNKNLFNNFIDTAFKTSLEKSLLSTQASRSKNDKISLEKNLNRSSSLRRIADIVKENNLSNETIDEIFKVIKFAENEIHIGIGDRDPEINKIAFDIFNDIAIGIGGMKEHNNAYALDSNAELSYSD